MALREVFTSSYSQFKYLKKEFEKGFNPQGHIFPLKQSYDSYEIMNIIQSVKLNFTS